MSKDFKRTRELKTFDDHIESEIEKLSPEEIIPFLTKQINKYENMLISVRYIRDRLNIEMHLDIYKNKLEYYVKFMDDPTLEELWQGYPDLNDPQFNYKIYNKEEFNRYQIKKQGIDSFTKEETLEFVKNPTQNFIGAYMSPNTPFNSLLLWLGVGVGKTCAALTAAENYRKDGGELTRSKITVLLPADSLIQSWKNQIFNLKKDLKNTNKNINVQCTGDTFKKEMDFYEEMTYDSKIRKVNKVINKYYEFMGYRKFANKVDKEINEIIKGREDRENLKIEFIKKKYSNMIFILDEVHFTRQYANNKTKNKDIAEKLELIARYGENNKFILASATPMYNSAIEIIEILNIMLLNDKRAPIEGYQVFKSDGYELTENGANILMEKSRGYISYLRGENPITFPVKIYPELSIAEGDAVDSYIPNPLYTLKKNELVDLEDENKIKDLSFIKCPMSKIQYEVYKTVAHGEEIDEEDEDGGDMGDGDNFSIPSTVASNLVYPIGKSGDILICLQGDKGFTEAFTTIAPTHENKSNLQYRYTEKVLLDNNEFFLSENNLYTFSSKFYNILQLVKRSEGICFFYSKYLKPGIVSLALMLEQNGYARFSEGNITTSMLYDQPAFQRCFCGRTNIEPHPKYDKTLPINNDNHPFTQGRYIFLTGETPKSTLNYYIDQCNGEGESTSNNLWGQHIKFVLGSNVLEQGINLYNVREVHVIDPWHHLNRTEQVVGRAIRNFSHKNLPPEKRNVSVYLYCATIPNESEATEKLRIETTDEKTYRHAYYKSKKIAIITRLFKQNAVDCLLNKNGNQLTVEYFGNTPLNIITSQKKILRNQFYGDHDYDIICDYNKCNYDCFGQPEGPYELIPTNKDTYDDILAMEDLSQGKKFIGRLFLLKNAYTIEEMLSYIDRYDQNINEKLLFRSLNEIVSNRESLYDNYHREGTIVYKHPYYIFQSRELDEDNISLYTRSIPLPIRNNSIIVSNVNDTLVKIAKKEVKLDDEDVFIKDFRMFIDNVGQMYIHKNTIYGDLANEINSEFLLALTNNPDPLVGFYLLELYFVFSVIDRLSYDDKRILISYILANNIENGGVKNPDDKLENAIFEMYEPQNGSTRNSIFRLDASGLPTVFRLYKSVYYPDTKKRVAEAFFFKFNIESRHFEPVEALDLLNFRTQYSYTYDQLKIDYLGDIVYGYLQEKERRSMAKLKAEEEIGEFKNEIEFYLVDKRNHISKKNKDDSIQHKSEIKGAVCGTATYLNINKPELIDLIQYLLGTNSTKIEKFLDSKSKINKHEDIYRVFAKSGSLCELIELLLRHKQYISPKNHFFFNFDEWEFMRSIRSEQEAAEKKKIEEQKKMKQPRGRKPGANK
jgi:hypothetical protein